MLLIASVHLAFFNLILTHSQHFQAYIFDWMLLLISCNGFILTLIIYL
jgi:hypothetical protein